MDFLRKFVGVSHYMRCDFKLGPASNINYDSFIVVLCSRGKTP